MYAGDIKMNVCRYRNAGSYGLLYSYANKSRRKVPSVILLILLALLFSTSLNVCAGDEKVQRVDPLGTIWDFNPCMTSFLSVYPLIQLFHTPLDALAAFSTHATSHMKFNFHLMTTSSSTLMLMSVNFQRKALFMCVRTMQLPRDVNMKF